MIPTTTQLLTFFNLFVGVMLVTSILLFCGGFLMYLTRLGTWPTYREEAVEIMKWGVSVLFTLVIILAIQQFLLSNLTVAVTVLVLIFVALVFWAYMTATAAPPKKEEGGRDRG
ncbi:hypothetical protein C4568_02045 [Candidatus Parcubacteria bacterium]|nr:MAG: hypothetical protein C4568_02045 [Candidatus Parcubacteria bacterium]